MGFGDILEKVRVKAEFEPIIVESWFDLVDAVLRIKGIFPNMQDDQLLELLNLEEFKTELAQAPTQVDPNQANVPVNTPQDLVNKEINKTITQSPMSAKTIDNEIIKSALDAKKLEILKGLDKMIKNADTEETTSNKKRS